MLYPTNGARLYIADAPADEVGAYPGSGWVEIGETEALGLLGVEWEQIDTADVEANAVGVLKGVMIRQPMEILLGNDPTDAGQRLIWAASRSRQSYPFRLLFPGGSVTRRWFALVMSIGEVFDSANSVIKLQVALQPTSDILRSEDA
ncbi:MAG: hypothetical protein Q4615_06330 [Paracoccus aminovorans]|nr:hypothetical protein [Paracoccus aminovorans]